MTRALPALAGLLALAACAPVAYVPPLIPAAPPRAGLWVGGGANALGAQASASLAVAPAGGAALVARGLYGGPGGDGGGSYVARGGDLNAVLARPLSRRVSVDAGASAGRDVIDATEGSFDIGCCSVTYRPVRLRTVRVGGHVGLLASSAGGRFRAGPALRVTRVSVRDERPGHEGGAGLFVEPALRLGLTTGPVELQGQAGLSLPAGDGFSERYSAVPLFVGASASVRL